MRLLSIKKIIVCSSTIILNLLVYANSTEHELNQKTSKRQIVYLSPKCRIWINMFTSERSDFCKFSITQEFHDIEFKHVKQTHYTLQDHIRNREKFFSDATAPIIKFKFKNVFCLRNYKSNYTCFNKNKQWNEIF